MNNKTTTTKYQLIPKLRFPEFRDTGEWDVKRLGKFTKLINERAGENTFKLMSVTAGIGLVSQEEKFGREIAGKSYKNYIVMREGDFAYNKSATKEYPEGFIALLEGQSSGAVPNSIFTCFRIIDKGVNRNFLNHFFFANYHGFWLRKFITVGGRAHGALSVDSTDLLKMPIAIPSLEEQRKIADCLTSLDDLITRETQKLETLEAYKKGLLQNLFPAEGQTIPALRFPEFQNAKEWVKVPFGNLIQVYSGKGFKASEYSETGIRLLQIENVSYGKIKWNENVKYLPENYLFEYPELSLHENDIVLALNRPITNGELKIAKLKKNDIPSILYQRVGRIERITDLIIDSFVFPLCQNFVKSFVLKRSIGSDQPFISLKDLYGQSISFPSQHKEQQEISSCFSFIDSQIIIQSQKVESLQAHKKGLLQQLFPSPEEDWV